MAIDIGLALERVPTDQMQDLAVRALTELSDTDIVDVVLQVVGADDTLKDELIAQLGDT